MRRLFDQTDSNERQASNYSIPMGLRTGAHGMKSRRYHYVIGAALLLLAATGGVILFQMQKIRELHATAVNTFYAVKSGEILIGKLEQGMLKIPTPAQTAVLMAERDKVSSLEKEYQNLIKELDIYAKASPEDRAIMRVAHTFGECEVDMPKSFPGQVKQYIARWKSSDRLQKALSLAQQKGYTPLILNILTENKLSPRFFFVALQESNFNDRAIGPATHFGSAKGLWQFITPTARDFGLHPGPLHDKPVFDRRDDRFDPVKSTVAASKYLKSLNDSYAQGSGLLVLALYNMGEGSVQKIIGQMPPDPRERNFWRLLSMKDIPKEIYDYVLSIVAAAVICEDPKLFGFDCNCPAFERTELPGPTVNFTSVSSDSSPSTTRYRRFQHSFLFSSVISSRSRP